MFGLGKLAPRLGGRPPDGPAAAMSGWAQVLWQDPPVIATWSSRGVVLGALSVPDAFAGQDVAVLLLPAWSLEMPDTLNDVAGAVRSHAAAHPGHRITVAGSNEAELAVLRAQGLDCVLANANCFTDEEIFRPLPGIAPQFDAVYNGRLSAGKRHELAVEVASLVLVYFRDAIEQDVPTFHAIHAATRALLPRARFANRLTEDGCKWLSQQRVNEVYARARVGLCLSAVEGTMRVSMEYLMAGLPVVSTASLGGRDFFFDPDYCLVVEDDPRAVGEAVDALVRRNVPRSHVRARTMERVRRARADFVATVDRMIAGAGGAGSFAGRFNRLLRNPGLQQWQPLVPFVSSLAARA
jgi:hypothetical protein